MNESQCACACGHASFAVTGRPRFRMLCHCTICQRFNAAPFADIVIYAARDVALPAAGTVDFDTYRPPPNVQRGKCVRCGSPAIETFTAPLLPKLAMVPAAVHPVAAALPPPAAHFFYDTRVRDADDALPRYAGYVPSQLGFLRHLVAASFGRG